MEHPSNQQVQPIDSLTPFLSGKWWIRARATDKSDVRTWNKPSSSGKLFSFTLIDESASIRATVFNDAVDTFDPLIVNGQVYYFSGGQVKNANRKFSNVNNDYELTFDSNSQILKANDAGSSAIPLQRYNFVPVAILKQREVGSLVDVLAVVLSVDEITNIVQKATGRELTKRSVKVGDSTAAVEVTLWGEQAKQWTHATGTVLAMRQLKVGSYDGVTLSATFQTSFDVNPNIPDVKRLSDWFITTGGADVASLSSLGGGAGSGGENFRGRKYLDDIAAEGLGRGQNYDYIEVRCVPVFLKMDNLWYDACPHCRKKVNAEGAQSDRYRCEACDKTVAPSQRYLVSMQVTDNVSQMWLTLFDEAGVEFFGMTAAQLKLKRDEDSVHAVKIAQMRINRPVLMRLRVKESSVSAPGGEETERVRAIVVRITDFMPSGEVTDEKRLEMATHLKAECNDMIKCIEAYA